MAIYVTHGARKNVGDYLIHHRGRALLEKLLPESTIRSVARWRKDRLPEDAELLVLCGGPGVSSRMVEDTFPIVSAAGGQDISIAGIALGWSGLPGRDPLSFSMSARTLRALHAISSGDRPITVRDDVTKGILEAAGIDVVRTGCTAWYSLDHLGRSVIETRSPRTVVFTTPARPQNTREAIAIMRLLRRRFPTARRVASFHRGILPDKETDPIRASALVAQSIAARTLGFEVLDASYDLSKIDFYGSSDLHVGYRVHAHLAFVSQHRPSILVAEDGRGYGQMTTLNPGRPALWNGDAGLVDKLDELLSRESSTGWPSLKEAVEVIESTYPEMKAAVQRLGKGR